MITLILKGILRQKGNSRMVGRRANGQTFNIKNPKVQKSVNDFILQAQSQYKGKPLSGELFMYAKVYYPTRAHDLDDSLLCDILQKAGIVENDRMIFHKELHKYFDKKNPRVEVTITDDTEVPTIEL